MSESTVQATAPPVSARRKNFVNGLYQLGAALESSNGHQVAWARRTLARMRRSLTDVRYTIDVLDIVYEHAPPAREEEVWLLTAGLFGLYPEPPTGGKRRLPLGAALRAASAHSAAEARLRELVAADWKTLTYRLRQAVHLLRSGGIPLDYHRLLEDLLVLRDAPAGDERSHTVRLRWARDFHRRVVDPSGSSTDSTPNLAPDEEGDPT